VFALLAAHVETGLIRGYFFDEGYLRTSSKEFSLDNVDSRFVHLTNDAVQKNCTSYGVFEQANKLSYLDFEKFLQQQKGVSFIQII
jgi:tubulin--tyrosine ligase